ncbi:MAG TPA: ABC transporter permease [Gammaproteobacteria bacterium]|nr:ABC transporter permease [Gammaproteobacteria bacterium]
MFRHYLTVAARAFRRGPLTASVNVLTLALGISAFVIAYGVVSYWERSERYFANADRTYVMTATFQGRGGGRATPLPMTNRLYADYLRADFPELDAVARAQSMYDETGVAAGNVYAEMSVVGAEREFLKIFDLPFVVGDSSSLSQPNSAVLTQEAAARLFGSADPLGKTITLANVLDVTVTGVVAPVPEPSHLGRAKSASLRFDVLASWDTLDGVQAAARARAAARDPAAAARTQPPPNAPPQPENWLGGYCCTTYVMLSRDSTLTAGELNARLEAFGQAHIPLAQTEIVSLTIGAVPVTSLMTAQLDSQLLSGAPISITTLLLVLGTLVLVVACVNYANLATAQSARRAREVGLRKALGANRRGVMVQYLAESAVSTVLAILLSLAAVRLVTPLLRNAVGIDLGLALFDGTGFWLFLGSLLGAVTLLGGAYPALVLSGIAPVKAFSAGRSRIGPRFAGTILVGVQFAAASFLLIVVLVMYTQNDELERTGLGGTTDQLVVIANAPQFSEVDNELLRTELARLPQVRGVSELSTPPWSPTINQTALARTPDADATAVPTYLNFVGYDFFTTLGFTTLAGRGFDRAHGEDGFSGFNGGPVNGGRPINAVIDASLALKLGFESPQAAVDQTIYIPDTFVRAFGGRAVEVRVVGVVADKPLHLRGGGSTSNVYWLQPGQAFQIMRVAANDVSGGLQAIDAAWKRISPKIPISRDFMDQLFDRSYENFARMNQVFGGLALVAVAIALIGLFGMAIHVAGRRVREIGVRKSIGAHTSQVVVMLIRDFSKPVLIANLIAWPLAYFAAQQYLSVFMHRIPLTPGPFGLSLVLVLGVSWLAVGAQTVRAARVNPATVLRVE